MNQALQGPVVLTVAAAMAADAAFPASCCCNACVGQVATVAMVAMGATLDDAPCSGTGMVSAFIVIDSRQAMIGVTRPRAICSSWARIRMALTAVVGLKTNLPSEFFSVEEHV